MQAMIATPSNPEAIRRTTFDTRELGGWNSFATPERFLPIEGEQRHHNVLYQRFLAVYPEHMPGEQDSAWVAYARAEAMEDAALLSDGGIDVLWICPDPQVILAFHDRASDSFWITFDASRTDAWQALPAIRIDAGI